MLIENPRGGFAFLRGIAPYSAGAVAMAGFEVASVDPPPGGTDTVEDAVIDLEITSNRPDCLSVIGIAREVATLYDATLRVPPVASLGAADAAPSCFPALPRGSAAAPRAARTARSSARCGDRCGSSRPSSRAAGSCP